MSKNTLFHVDFYLLGFTRTQLFYSKSNDRWEISDITNETLAFMDQSEPYPIGARHWFFTNSTCTDDGQDYRTLNLHPYVEQPGFFCCKTGACIDSEKACDGLQDCYQGEDEENCKIMEVPFIYDIEKSPPEIFIEINIVDILSIYESHSTFDVFFNLKIKEGQVFQ